MKVLFKLNVPSNIVHDAIAYHTRFTTSNTHAHTHTCNATISNTTKHSTYHFISDICLHNGQRKTDYCLLDVKYKNTVPGAIRNNIEQCTQTLS